jgi:cytochrome P450
MDGVEAITLTVAELERDPHQTYRTYRPRTPLIRREDGSYIAIRARDVEKLITDPRTRQMETDSLRVRGVTSGALYDFFAHSMLFTNGPVHRRRRSPLSRAFAVQLIADLRPRIRAVANELIDAAEPRREMDLLDEYSALIPARIIADILGIEPSDVPRFTRWAYTMARAINSSFTRADIPEIEEAARQLTAYVQAIIVRRQAQPKDDLISSFVKGVDGEGNLSAFEAAIQVVTLILAGSDTTRAAMTMQVSLLLQHRKQWEAVCRNATLIPGAVAEALRYEPSVGSVPRFTLTDIEIDGITVPANRLLTLSTVSAMRDPECHEDPDRFNIRRTDLRTRHLVFGGGSHRCLGEALAKAELEEGLAALAARLPQLQIVGEPAQMLGHSGIRRVTEMRVGWAA